MYTVNRMAGIASWIAGRSRDNPPHWVRSCDLEEWQDGWDMAMRRWNQGEVLRMDSEVSSIAPMAISGQGGYDDTH